LGVPAFVGLTGGIGAGKSTALQALARLGAATLSSDQVVHELYAEPEVRDAVVERFGAEVAPAGVIDRAALAQRAFATSEGRAWLEGLLWPKVGARIVRWRSATERQMPAPRALVVEVPLLFEAGMESSFDATLSVISEEALRHSRATARDHRALAERVSRQLTQEEKCARSTYVVHNDGSVAELELTLSRVLDMLEESMSRRTGNAT
jgi:dephospho-CoA kinase